MAETETLILRLVAENKDLRKKLKDTNKRIDTMSKNTQKLGKKSEGFLKKMRAGWLAVSAAVIAVTRAVIRFGKKAIEASLENEIAQAKFQKVFRGSIGVAKEFREELTTSFAQSETQATILLSSIQDLIVPMGVARDRAAQLSGETVKLASKIAAFNPQARGVEDVMQAMQSAMVGMFRPMQRFGVVMTQATVTQEALRLGLIKTKKEMNAAARAQAVLSLVTQGSSDAIERLDQFVTNEIRDVIDR